MEDQKNRDEIDIEWENRTLCRDESCIGVIGEDGVCKECGLPYLGSPSQKAPPNRQSPFDEAEAPAPDARDADSDGIPDDEWKNRVLCADGNCIGVIGPDGRCKECGKPLDMEQDPSL